MQCILRHTEDGERTLEDFGIWEMIWHVEKGQDIQKVAVEVH